jgi:hypothetical protein
VRLVFALSHSLFAFFGVLTFTALYAFRVTDINGSVLEDSGIQHVENGTVPGSGQFP